MFRKKSIQVPRDVVERMAQSFDSSEDRELHSEIQSLLAVPGDRIVIPRELDELILARTFPELATAMKPTRLAKAVEVASMTVALAAIAFVRDAYVQASVVIACLVSAVAPQVLALRRAKAAIRKRVGTP